MAITLGYPCSNLTLQTTASRTFRLASWSRERFIEVVTANLETLALYLDWNRQHGIRFFRISSDTIPFASHPVMDVRWQELFAPQLAAIGEQIRLTGTRINVHPGQYTLLNSPREDVGARSLAELVYHAELMDVMGLDHTHKIQIHVGGVYGDKPAAIERFVKTHADLPEPVRTRLVIENDERHYSLADAFAIHEACGVPVLLDIFHHELFNNGESITTAIDLAIPTWQGHGLPMMDFSTQHPDRQAGAHAMSVELRAFGAFLDAIGERDIDVMLEIKDKESSTLQAMALAAERGMLATPA